MRDPLEAGFTIAKSDSSELSHTTRGIYVAASGSLRVLMTYGTDITFPTIAAGIFHELSVRKVFASGTTASGIIGLY